MKKIIFSIALLFAIATMQTVKAQYPSINDSVKHLWTEKGRVADSLSDIAWAKALPIVEKKKEKENPMFFGQPVQLICLRQTSLHSPVQWEVVLIHSEAVVAK